jgi:hypothetical protein
LLGGLVALAGCRASPAPEQARERQVAPVASVSGQDSARPPAKPAASGTKSALLPVEPAAPGTRSGLPNDRTPVSEAPFAASSAQGAAQVVQSYFALIEAGRYAEALRLWEGAGEASGTSEKEFAAELGRYREYHAEVGAPGRMEGAAGSSYVGVPVQLYGRLKDGTPFRRRAEVTLRRVNDVAGSTEEERRWRIRDIATGDAPDRD